MGKVVTEVHWMAEIGGLPNVAQVCWDLSVNYKCEELWRAFPVLPGHLLVG